MILRDQFIQSPPCVVRKWSHVKPKDVLMGGRAGLEPGFTVKVYKHSPVCFVTCFCVSSF